MAGLVLGPLLRYTGSTQATVWVETDAPCEVAVLDARAAHLLRRGPPLRARRAERPRRGLGAAVRGAARRRARLAARRRPAAVDDPHAGARAPRAPRLRLLPGRRSGAPAVHARALRASARVRHRRPLGVLAPAAVRRGRSGPTACSCSATRSTRTRRRRRRAPSSARGATRACRRASRSPTSRSTRGSTASPGATPTSAGCSRPCRAR